MRGFFVYNITTSHLAYMPVVPTVDGLKVATSGVAPGVITPMGFVCTHSTLEIEVPGAGVRTNPIVSSRSILACGVMGVVCIGFLGVNLRNGR
jgi:hypothetical protein